MTTENAKLVAETIYYIVAAIAAGVAVVVFYRNSSLERAKWASTLYDKFYGSAGHRSVCDSLDSKADNQAVNDIVAAETSAFTDYLNFFEYVGFLVKVNQLDYDHVETLFGYYLSCMDRHRSVKNYINNRENSFEELQHLLLRRSP